VAQILAVKKYGYFDPATLRVIIYFSVQHRVPAGRPDKLISYRRISLNCQR
jgi:hypothetical protein